MLGDPDCKLPSSMKCQPVGLLTHTHWQYVIRLRNLTLCSSLTYKVHVHVLCTDVITGNEVHVQCVM